MGIQARVAFGASLADAETVYAGVEDAAMFRSTDGGRSWHEMNGLRGHGSGRFWQPGAGGMGLHTILIDRANLIGRRQAPVAATVSLADVWGFRYLSRLVRVRGQIQAVAERADLDARRQSCSEPTRLNTERLRSVWNVAHRHCPTSSGRRDPLGAALSA